MSFTCLIDLLCSGRTRYFPIDQFVFVAFEDMANDGDGIQRNIDLITDHIGVSYSVRVAISFGAKVEECV